MSPRKKKVPVRSGVMVAKIWPLLEEAIEEGVDRGLYRADKHANDELTLLQAERVKEHVCQQVTSSILERFTIKDEPDD